MARFTFDEEGNKKVAAQHKGPGKQPPQRAAATGVKPKQQQQHRGPQHQHQRGVKGAAKAPAAADAELWGAPQRAKAAGPQRVQDAGHKRKREAADDEHYRRALRRMEAADMSDDDDDDEEEEEQAAAAGADDAHDRRRALRRMEAGPSDDDGDMSEDEEEEEPAASKGRQPQASALRGRLRAPPQPSRPAHLSDSEGEDEEEDEEDDDGPPAHHGIKRSQAANGQQRQRAGAESSSDSDADGSEDSDDEEEEEEEEEDSEAEEAMQQLAELPLETRLALLRDGTGPRGEVARAAAQEARVQQAGFKRLNKHRPQEMSSKKPVSRFREIIEPARKKSRDPRFERFASDREKDAAARRYAFLYDEVLAQEKQQLKAGIKKERQAGAKKAALAAQLQRVEQALAREQQRRRRTELEAKVKAEQRSKAASGQTPYFLKASDKRKLELVAKYEQLRKQGKLDRYMEKRRKHNASKDHRYLPSGRRDAGGGGDV